MAESIGHRAEGEGKMEEGKIKSKTCDMQPAMIFPLKFADNCGRIVPWVGQASQEGYGSNMRPRWAIKNKVTVCMSMA
jgi:hypothetical protein